MSATTDSNGRWFPIAGVEDLVPGHIFEAQLLGRELAAWRARQGNINVWENRCPHRGVRLTVGSNLGVEVRCAYHGYRYQDGVGRCSVIPAHPNIKPPATLVVGTFPVATHHGLVWTSLDGASRAPTQLSSQATDSTKLHSMPFNVSAERLAECVLSHRFEPIPAQPEAEGVAPFTMRALDPFTFESTVRREGDAQVRWFLQPVCATSTVIHGCLSERVPLERRVKTLKQYYWQMARLRRAAEACDPVGEQPGQIRGS